MTRIKETTKEGVDHKIDSRLPPSKNIVQVRKQTPSDAIHSKVKNIKNTVDNGAQSSQKNIKNWIAWKWKWALAAWKAKKLSQQMKELEDGSVRNSNSSTASKLDLEQNNKKKADHRIVPYINPRCIRKMGDFDNNAIKEVPIKTNARSVPPPPPPREPDFEEEEDIEERMTVSKVAMEDLQGQVAQISGCMNKMMPALVFLTKKAGNQRLADDCLGKWKGLSTTTSSRGMEDHHNPPHHHACSPQIKLDRCNNNNPSMTISLSPTRNLTIRTARPPPPKVQRKTRMAVADLPSRPGLEVHSTFKSLQTLQTSLHSELQELQGLLASEIGVLQRKKPMSYSALMSVWEVAESVEQVLKRAKERLRMCGSKESRPHIERPTSPNRHRQPCHAIMTQSGRGGATRALCRYKSSRAALLPSPSPPRTAIIEMGGDGEVKISAAASPRDAAARAKRRCTAAEHASRLRRQIEGLQARQRSICLRLHQQ